MQNYIADAEKYNEYLMGFELMFWFVLQNEYAHKVFIPISMHILLGILQVTKRCSKYFIAFYQKRPNIYTSYKISNYFSIALLRSFIYSNISQIISTIVHILKALNLTEEKILMTFHLLIAITFYNRYLYEMKLNLL